ncbi:hypothetical protein QYE76_024560 [Lolium multiflorum]|uniref:Uncharacterized protein n=1 Tax=Lolium multiflorum TaxID=4521 RepID=A0AAD8RCC0_LOLMU|nr:hypothetical protein QYE76_024560 [Lolium multiflorum]
MLKCPIHELPRNVIVNNFYARLSGQHKDYLDACSEGSFTSKEVEAKWDLLDRIEENVEGWENNKGEESGYANKPPFKPLPPKEGNEEKEEKKKKKKKKKKKGTKKKKKKKKENKKKESSAVPEVVPVPPAPTTEEANDNDHETSNEETTEPRRSTRERATPDWYDPCLNVMIVDNNDEDPATYEEAMMSPDSNKWQEAMKSEMGSMYDNKVWTLVDLLDSRKAVKNKWIFKRKTDADGSSRPRGGGKVKPSSRRHRDEDEQEEIVSARTTKRQREAAAGKRTAQGPQKSMVDLKKSQFLEVRGTNLYFLPRNAHQCPNPFFHHVNKERIYNEVYGAKEFNCCPQYSISMDKLNSNLEYFGEALEICEEQGLNQLMTFSHNYSKEVICQFYATVVFLEDEGGFRSLKWMTREHVMEATWEDFARGIGYELTDYDTNVFWIHIQAKPMAKEKMADLYIPGRMLCGSAYNLLPVYDIMNRIYRSTINPKHTNHDEVHGFLVNLLVRTQ